MRTILILCLFLCSASVAAQESQYEQMKQSLDEHSLPLVNMIVDIGKVNIFIIILSSATVDAV